VKPQVFSGARGRITFKDSDGKDHVLALVTDVSISENAGLRPTFVVGAEGPVGIEPLSMDVTASIGRIIPMNDITSSEARKAITSIEHRFEEVMSTIMTRDHVEITIEDTKSNEGNRILAVVKYARFAGRSTSVNSGDVGSERYNFIGIFDAGYGANSNAPDQINYGFE